MLRKPMKLAMKGAVGRVAAAKAMKKMKTVMKKGGKAKNLADVEKYLAGQQGVDMAESRAIKQTEAGKKKVTALAAAKGMGQSSGAGLGQARAHAREAMRKAKSSDDVDPDGSGQQYSAAL